MVIYRIKEGDTLQALARRMGILPTDLAEDNRLSTDAPLPVGRALLLRTRGERYRVREGDTLASIARRHRLSCARLRQWNPTLKTGEPYPGMSLTVQPCEPSRGTLTVLGYAHAETPKEELTAYLPYLSYLAVCECRLSETGEPIPPRDEAIVAAARSGGAIPLLVLTTAGAGGREGEAERRRLLLAEESRRRTTDTLITLLQARGYGGILLDLGEPEEDCSEATVSLLGLLRRRLGHTATVALSLPPFPSENARHLLRLGRAAGVVALESHAFSTCYREPAPAAPYDKVSGLAACACQAVRPEKLLLGISARGCDYRVGRKEGGRYLDSEAIAARLPLGTVSYDPIGRVPYLSYREENEERLLFFEDAESIREKLLLIDRLGIGGIGIFPLVGTDPTLLLLMAEMFRIAKPHGE